MHIAVSGPGEEFVLALGGLQNGETVGVDVAGVLAPARPSPRLETIVIDEGDVLHTPRCKGKGPQGQPTGLIVDAPAVGEDVMVEAVLVEGQDGPRQEGFHVVTKCGGSSKRMEPTRGWEYQIVIDAEESVLIDPSHACHEGDTREGVCACRG